MIQEVVSRLATCSFQLKGWIVTLTAALVVFLKDEVNPIYLFVPALPVIAFWLLDAWYLRQERLFRRLYDDVRCKEGVADFSMDTRPFRNTVGSVMQVAFFTDHYPVQARFNLAEPLIRRALGIDEKSYGQDHPNVAIDLNNLAQLLKATNRLGEAKPLYRQVLRILSEFGHRTGDEHPHFRTAINNYAELLAALEGEPEDSA